MWGRRDLATGERVTARQPGSAREARREWEMEERPGWELAAWWGRVREARREWAMEERPGWEPAAWWGRVRKARWELAMELRWG